MRTKQNLIDGLRALGVEPGVTMMVHCSLRAMGPIKGGPQTLLDALLWAVGKTGTILAYVSWDMSPYEETLNGGHLSQQRRDAWPVFDPETSDVYPGFGALNRFIIAHPEMCRSQVPDASMAAIGADASWLTAHQPFVNPYGVGSPLEKLVASKGKVLLLGAPLDAITVLHYAEVRADIQGKRRVSYQAPVLLEQGQKIWKAVEEYDTNGILDQYALDGRPDAIELIARDFCWQKKPPSGLVGAADCLLLDAAELVDFGIDWLEARHKGEC